MKRSLLACLLLAGPAVAASAQDGVGGHHDDLFGGAAPRAGTAAADGSARLGGTGSVRLGGSGSILAPASPVRSVPAETTPSAFVHRETPDPFEMPARTQLDGTVKSPAVDADDLPDSGLPR